MSGVAQAGKARSVRRKRGLTATLPAHDALAFEARAIELDMSKASLLRQIIQDYLRPKGADAR